MVRKVVVHEVPVESVKLEHPPLDGEKLPLAGPPVIVMLNVLVSPWRTI